MSGSAWLADTMVGPDSIFHGYVVAKYGGWIGCLGLGEAGPLHHLLGNHGVLLRVRLVLQVN